MTTVCVAGQSAIAIGVLRDALNMGKDIRVVGLPNPSDVTVTEKRWQPSFREYLNDLAIDEVSLEWCERNPELLMLSCEFERLLKVDRFLSDSLYNIHFSLLPAHKGAYPTTHAILKGDEEAGPTLHSIDSGIDTGPIVAKSPRPIRTETTALDIYMDCQIEGRRLVRENLKALLEGRVRTHSQPSKGSTFESRKSLDFSVLRAINPKASAEQVERQIRAANFRPYQMPTFAGATISGSRILETQSRQPCGTVLHRDDKAITIATIDFDIALSVDKYPRFWRACRLGQVAEVSTLLPSIHRVDEWDSRGQRALLHAVQSGSVAVTRLLLESGADPYNLNGFGLDAHSLAVSLPSTQTRSKMIRTIEAFQVVSR